MKTEELIEIIVTELEIEDDNVNLQTEFNELDEWDSMSTLMLMGLVVREFDVNLDAKELESLTDFQSLVDKIGVEKFD